MDRRGHEWELGSRLREQPARTHLDRTAPERVGSFLIEREIARGGMGAIYQAYDVRSGRRVALKMLLAAAQATPAQRQRFRTEAAALARLRHPHVVAVHSAGEEGGLPYLVMDLVPNESLQQRLDQRGALPPREAASLVRDLGRAVEAAHAQGVLHRDLKPSNVLLSEGGRPLLTDFGLAKLLDSESDLTRTGAMLGTPGYMAPEQAAGDRSAIGPATDVYGLGAVLYALLVGEPPFADEAASPLELVARVVSLPPTPPRALRPDLPRDLERICLVCLAKEPRDRYPSAAALAADLERTLRGEPVWARPLTRGQRAWRWLQRRRALAGIATAGGVGLLALMWLGPWRELTPRLFDAPSAAASMSPRAEALAKLDAAQALLDQGQAQAAIAACTQALALDPTLAAAHAARASAIDSLDGYRGAVEDLERAIELEPRAEWHVALGELRIWSRDPAEFARAERDLTRALELDPSLANAWAQRGVLRNRRRDTTGAEADYTRALAIDPDHLEALEMRGQLRFHDDRPAEALPDLERAVALGPSSPLLRAFLGRALVRVGQLERGRRELDRAVEEAPPDRGLPWRLRALTRLESDDLRGAQEDFDAAIAREPDGHVARIQRGQLRQRLGDRLGALEDFTAASEVAPDLPAAWSELGVLRHDHGDLQGALQAFDRELQLAPRSPHTLRRRAEVRLALGDGPGALSDAEQGLALAPDASLLYSVRGAIRLDARDHEGALADLQRALELDASVALNWFRRAKVRARLDDLPGAEQDLDRALQLAPGYADARAWRAEVRYLRGDARARIEEDLEAALRSDPRCARAYEVRSILLQEDGRAREAIESLSRAIEHQPADAERWVRRALLHIETRELAAAVYDATRAIELNEAGRGYQVRGHAHYLLGRLPEALEDLDRALALGESRDALVNRALTQSALGRPERALPDFERAVALAPDDPRVLVGRGMARLRLGRLQSGLADLDRALTLRPDDANTLATRGFIRLVNGLEGVEEDVQRALALDPRNVMALNTRIAWLRRRGEHERAVSACEQVLTIAPRDLTACFTRADSLEELGRLEEAREAYRACLKLDPRQAATWLGLGRVREALGDRPGAREAYAEAAEQCKPGEQAMRAEARAAAERLRGE